MKARRDFFHTWQELVAAHFTCLGCFSLSQIPSSSQVTRIKESCSQVTSLIVVPSLQDSLGMTGSDRPLLGHGQLRSAQLLPCGHLPPFSTSECYKKHQELLPPFSLQRKVILLPPSLAFFHTTLTYLFVLQVCS